MRAAWLKGSGVLFLRLWLLDEIKRLGAEKPVPIQKMGQAPAFAKASAGARPGFCAAPYSPALQRLDDLLSQLSAGYVLLGAG